MNSPRHRAALVLVLLTAMFAVRTLRAQAAGDSAGLQVQAFGHRVGRDHMAEGSYDEPYRPQFHFTPARNWMNDPNGPIYYKGEYHLFYQYNPFGTEWGHMSWGHAASPDLVHWKHLPVALTEENGVMIFSGSTVVDWHNSSGFCRGSDAKAPSCLVAIYTGHSPKLQTQNLAYSNDDGLTWTKYSGNPVIDLHLSGFRDPKVFWHADTHKWVMVTVLASQHKVRLFGSTDLKHWTVLSDFGPAGATGGAWECPDLFPLKVDDESGQTKWVLSINVNPGGVAGGSGNQYFVGSFDGTTFAAEGAAEQTLWVDYGADFYASTSFSDILASDGRRIWLGWLNNWKYAARVPTDPWRGAQSVPRELKLRRFPGGIRLVQEPVAELRALRERHTRVKGRSIEAANRRLKSKGVRGQMLEIVAEIDPRGAAEFGFKVRKGDGEETVIGVDMRQSKLFVDRTRSGVVSFDEHFPSRDAGPIELAGEKSVGLHIFVDCSSVEVFGNGGEIVLSETIFPRRSSDGIELYSKDGQAQVLKVDVWNLKSAYR
ncbi:MAG: glycoside hydrolase family 32 protein [Terriglobales bacterium]